MESILSATPLTLYKFRTDSNRFSHSFPTRPSQITPLRLRKRLTPSKSTGKLVTPAASAAFGAGEEQLGDSQIDTIVLGVKGMACEGCVSSVKKILESQPQVSAANVNLAKEMAIIWPVAEAKAMPGWQSQLGENLAKHLTSCGFDSNLQALKNSFPKAIAFPNWALFEHQLLEEKLERYKIKYYPIDRFDSTMLVSQ